MLIRVTVISLVLINLLLMGWNRINGGAEAQVPTESNGSNIQGVPSLRLLSELSPEEIQKATPQLSCYSIGPFDDQEQLQQVSEQMGIYSETLQSRETVTQVERNYWVYIPPAESLIQAQETADGLAAAGVNDYFIVDSGEMNRAISLGVFSSMRNANAQQERVDTLGYTSQIRTNYDSQNQYWLDYQLTADVESPWLYLLPNTEGLSQTDIGCETLGSPATSTTTLAENQQGSSQTTGTDTPEGELSDVDSGLAPRDAQADSDDPETATEPPTEAEPP